jgi:hypothetical protein
MKAAVVLLGNMNAIIVALNSLIKQLWIGIYYFVGPWRIYGVVGLVAAVYRWRHRHALPTMH